MTGKTATLPELAGTKEAAAIFGVRTLNFLRDWAKRPDFPTPIATLATTQAWRRCDLESYRSNNRPRMNPDLLMGDVLKKTGAGNLFTVFGQPDVEVRRLAGDERQVEIRGVDIFDL